MNEGFGLVGQLLNDDVSLSAIVLGAKSAGNKIDALSGSSAAVPNEQYIFAGNKNIPALN